jgi:hypothetical protein
MAQKPRPTENVVPLFGDDDIGDDITWGRKIIPPAPAPLPTGATVDLTGKPKVMMAIGGGSVGKTTFLKWCTEQLLARDSDARLVAIDPENRDLKNFFQGVYEPADSDPARVTVFLKGFSTHW